MKKQVIIDEETHRLLKIYAADKKIPMCDAIASFLDQEEKEK